MESPRARPTRKQLFYAIWGDGTGQGFPHPPPDPREREPGGSQQEPSTLLFLQHSLEALEFK